MVSFTESKLANAINSQDAVLAPYLAKVDKYDSEFICEKLFHFSDEFKRLILKAAFDKEVRAERNRYILRTSNELLQLLPAKLAHLFGASDDLIKSQAKEHSDHCHKLLMNPKTARQLALSKTGSISELTSAEIEGIAYSEVCRYVEGLGIAPPDVKAKDGSLTGSIKRLTDNRWWLKKFRRLVTQATEQAAIIFNLVNSKRQIYASNTTTRNRISQRLRNDELLSHINIINDAGQRYSLKEVSDLNISNPKIRKDELICRARGFEDLAKDLGHEALFITITCPSKYHRAFAKSGAQNPKWQGFMPNQSNDYLCHQWTKIRAEFQRQNINPYGFRVVEPQHDGTPHWHMLFFVDGDKLAAMQKIIRHYALEVDGDEKGAAENRCDFKKIDPKKGSATGYILKYIVKNIDGEGLGEDFFGNDSIKVAQRIDAWASCWCIRQFQQIGGASVSVWRELRRLKEKFPENSILEQARNAADNSDWKGYLIAMGGIDTPQKQQPIKLYYEVNVNTETGECSQSYYDGDLIMKIKGLWFAGKSVLTRLFSWKLEMAPVKSPNYHG